MCLLLVELLHLQRASFLCLGKAKFGSLSTFNPCSFTIVNCEVFWDSLIIFVTTTFLTQVHIQSVPLTARPLSGNVMVMSTFPVANFFNNSNYISFQFHCISIFIIFCLFVSLLHFPPLVASFLFHLPM